MTYHHRGLLHNISGLKAEVPRSQTLVVLGNGPSLRASESDRLRSYDAIGMNAAYRYWEEIGSYPQYYICLDKVVGVSHQGPIEKLIENSDQNGIELFLLRQNLIDRFPKDVKSSPKIINFDELKNIPNF